MSDIGFAVILFVCAVIGVVFLRLSEESQKKVKATTGPQKRKYQRITAFCDIITYSSFTAVLINIIFRYFKKLSASYIALASILAVVVGVGIYLATRKKPPDKKKKGGTPKRSWWQRLTDL